MYMCKNSQQFNGGLQAFPFDPPVAAPSVYTLWLIMPNFLPKSQLLLYTKTRKKCSSLNFKFRIILGQVSYFSKGILIFNNNNKNDILCVF